MLVQNAFGQVYNSFHLLGLIVLVPHCCKGEGEEVKVMDIVSVNYIWSVWCLLCLMFRLILQGDVGLPGPAGPPPSTGELEFMGFPKGKKGSKVVNI